MSRSTTPLQALRKDWQLVGVAVFVVVFITALGALFYLRGQVLMREQLRDRLRDTAAIAAQQIDPETVKRVRGAASLKGPDVKALVTQLRAIRSALPTIRYVYLMRRTPDPMRLEFVADADSLGTIAEMDRNGDRVIDPDEEASYPGDPYDIADVPALQHDAFVEPTVDAEITHDQWGSFLSGYAPVRDASGQTVAVLGIDMTADQFLALARSMFSPLLGLLITLTAALFGGYLFVFLWRRKVAAQRRIDDERAGMMLLASHQLGKPLTLFQWTVESLEESREQGTLEKDIEEGLANMREGVTHLRTILNQLRRASDVEEGHFVYKPDWAYLREIIMQVVHETAPECKRKHQRVTMDLADLHLMLDQNLIANVLRELLQNAMTFSPVGGVITVVTRRRGDRAEVEVRDQGRGVPRKDLPRIFGKFVRASNAHLSRPDGNGLGLFIARGIVERAGGTMRIESEEGRGTSVFFTLPLGKA